MDFHQLKKSIGNAHNVLLEQATKSVNVYLTIRNWIIGYQIQEYEQNGKDRAEYGENLIEQLAEDLQKEKVLGCSARRLWDCRLFYSVYPNILQTLSAEFQNFINQSVIDSLIPQTVSAELGAESDNVPCLPGITLLRNLSFSHFMHLIKIDDSLKRSFYEIETVRGNWSSRELKRQISSLYYERSGLSKDKEKLAKLTHKDAHQLTPKDTIRDPYVF